MIERFARLPQLLLLAIVVLIYNVMAMAIANSLFISQVGAGELPIAFMLIGSCSLPFYGVFSQIADRYSRTKVFRYSLLVSMVMMLGLRMLLDLDAVWVYYVLLIAIFFQWDFNNNLLYPGLLTDYFTTIEYKQYAPFIGIAQAVGTLIGGAITLILSRLFPSRELLWSLPILMAIAFGQLVYLERSQRSLQTANEAPQPTILESLKTLPDLGKRYPLVLFLAGSSFLLVIIYISCEFLWFNIYGQQFNESELTGFLGLMRTIISLVQVVFLYGITRPLLKWIGVARLNTVYPVTTLLSLGALAMNFKLPAAIGLHINGDALYKSINLPIHQLNYNAIPHQYIGRIRTLSDGLIYSCGLTIAGGILWLCHLYLSLIQITWLAVALTVVLLAIRLPMGRFYLQSLEDMIRTDTIDLDGFKEQKTQLPPQSSKIIRESIASGDRYTKIKGLELAANLGNPGQFFDVVAPLFADADSSLRQGILKLFSSVDEDTLQQFSELLQDENSTIRAIALEALIANQYPFEPPQLESLIEDPDREVKALALVATFQATQAENLDASIAERFWQIELTDTTVKAIASVVRYSKNPEFITLIEYLLPRANSEAKQVALEALVSLASPQDYNLAKIAAAEIDNEEPQVRISAFKLLEVTRCPEILDVVASGLEDSYPQVRQQVANTLSSYGKAGLAVARRHLTSKHPHVVNTAIAAIAKVKSQQANEILLKHLAPEFQHLAMTRRWQQQIPQRNPSWRLLGVAIEDYQHRILQKVLYILSCLGYSRTVESIQHILATSDRRELANAVEVLASIEHRRFVQPLMPLLEQTVSTKAIEPIEPTPQWFRNKGYKILLEALDSSDRWIKTGASIALAMVPTTLLTDPDPIVRSVAREILPAYPLSCPISTSMNRLLLLRNLALFKNLTLDELFSIDKTLEQKQVLAGETIYTEGSWGWHLYIIAAGKVQIVKELDGEPQEIEQLTAGQYFGEIALFDDAPRWDGAIALEDTVLFCLEKKCFISLISQRPHIILEICRFLSKRLRETDKYMSAKKVRQS